MTTPIDQVAERVLAPWNLNVESESVRRHELQSAAPALAREVLALRTLCAAMHDALEYLTSHDVVVKEVLDGDREKALCAAIAAHRAHFNEPDAPTKEPG